MALLDSVLGLGSIVLIVVGVVWLLMFVFWIWVLIDAIMKKFDKKVLWIILIIFLGVVGAILYLIIVRPKLKNKISQDQKQETKNSLDKKNEIENNIQINKEIKVPKAQTNNIPPPNIDDSIAAIPKPMKTMEEDKPLFKIQEQTIPTLPDINDPKLVNIKYPLIPPYAYAKVSWDEKETELVYEIEEPLLSEHEKQILDILEDGIKELINLSFISVNDRDTVIIYLEKNIKVLLTELSIEITMDSYLRTMYYIYRDFVGLNELEPMMNDYFIEDIECNGLNSPLYIVHRKFRNIRTSLVYRDMHNLASFVEKLAQKCGRYVSYAEPLLDGSLPDGTRVNATFSIDVSSKGPTFTLRKFTKEPWSPLQLMIKGTASAEVYSYLWMSIEYEHSLMVIGGTGSGKTSFINSIAFFIPPQARVVSIEDTRELQLEHENWLPSVARSGVGLSNLVGQRYGEVSLFDLLRASFRQRPDYIIVGEVRGKEAFVLFQAFASGHPGMATMHAENVGTLIRRLETNPINLSGSLIETLSAVVVMAETKVKGRDVRKVVSIDEIVEVKEGLGGEVTNNVFRWDPRNNTFIFNPNSKVFENIATHYGFTPEQVLNEFNIRIRLVKELFKRGIVGFKEVQAVVHEYYKSPELVLRRFKLI